MRRGRSERTERPLPSGHWPGERASVVLPQYRVSSRYDGSRPQLVLATVSMVYGIQDNHTIFFLLHTLPVPLHVVRLRQRKVIYSMIVIYYFGGKIN